MGKNLQSSYLADGNPIPPPFGVQQPGDETINQIYEQSVIDQQTVEESGDHWKSVSFLDNKYGPAGGYKDILTINTSKLFTETHLEYIVPNTLQPVGFIQSCYNPYELYTEQNTTIGADSQLMLTALPLFRENLSENQTLNFEDGKNVYNISVTPGMTYLEGDDYLNRLSGNYDGTSEINGVYQSMQFIPDINSLTLNGISYQDSTANIQGAADAIVNLFTQGNEVPSNNTAVPAPSDNLISHMGGGQQSRLFEWGLVYTPIDQIIVEYNYIQM